MNTVKAIQTSFPLPNQSCAHGKKTASRQRLILCFCNSKEAGSGSSSPSEGDKRKQELLARIAMLQAQKVRLTDFLDERSAYLTQFAEDANAEFDKIGENALKELDEASARIMENLENRMQAFEETAEISKQEIEKNERILEEFEDKIDHDRNEGLFFKNLRQKAPQGQAEAMLERQKIREVTKESAGSKGFFHFPHKAKGIDKNVVHDDTSLEAIVKNLVPNAKSNINLVFLSEGIH